MASKTFCDRCGDRCAPGAHLGITVHLESWEGVVEPTYREELFIHGGMTSRQREDTPDLCAGCRAEALEKAAGQLRDLQAAELEARLKQLEADNPLLVGAIRENVADLRHETGHEPDPRD